MRLKAISLGYAVPHGDFEAAVHSVFPQAANLQRRKGSRLLTLVTAEAADLPQGMRLETPAGFSFEEKLNVGEKVVCRGSLKRDGHGGLEIDLTPAKRWRCRLPSIDMQDPSAATAWEVVWEALNARQRRNGAEICAEKLLQANLPGQTALARKMGGLVRELVEAARQCDHLSAKAGIAGLVGLGPGLTPAGDDFLVGFLVALHCTAGNIPEHLSFLSEVGKTTVHLARRTNDISRTYLFHAARGQVSSLLLELAQAVSRGAERTRLLPSAEGAMQVGHSSGMDTVTGLLVGLSAKWIILLTQPA